jgi:nucleoside-diphosphate-sugar epimerase
MYPFERFTERAKRVLSLAQQEAERAHHSYIGTEHLLLGLMREEGCLAAKALANLGVENNEVRAVIASVIGGKERILIQQRIPTSRVKQVIELSFEEARKMGNNHVGTEHLLLGLLVEGEGIAAHLLQDLGATLEKVRPEIDRLLRAGGVTEKKSRAKLRVIVLGGTRFIGRAIVEELAEHGHPLLIVHRGEHEIESRPRGEHLHAHRQALGEVASALHDFTADAVVDTSAMTRMDAVTALGALPDGLRLLVLSSADVYRAYAAVSSETESDPVPLTEASPVRAERYLYRGKRPDMDDYEKLDVEAAYLERSATVCRLPMVYGEHDSQRREEFILRRVRAKRMRIPIGAGNWLWSRGYVRDIARGVRLALEADATIGEVLNLCESQVWSIRLWAEHILGAAGSDAELVRVRDETQLPQDLRITRAHRQHLLVSPAKAQALLNWTETDPLDALRASVQWHLAHPPDEPDPGFELDDRALTA